MGTTWESWKSDDVKREFFTSSEQFKIEWFDQVAMGGLVELADRYPRLGKLVVLRLFGELSYDFLAQVFCLGSADVAKRRYERALELYRDIVFELHDELKKDFRNAPRSSGTK